MTFVACPPYSGTLDPVTIGKGEPIVLPLGDDTSWHLGVDCNNYGDDVGVGGESYTPTEDITLIGLNTGE